MEAFGPGWELLVSHLVAALAACAVEKGLFNWEFSDALGLKGKCNKIKVAMVKSEISNGLSLHPEDINAVLIHLLSPLHSPHGIVMIPMVHQTQLVIA